MDTLLKKKIIFHAITAVGVSVIGLACTSIGALYIAGMFGLSISFASQIVRAFEVGGWALAIVMGTLTGGTGGILAATIRWAISHMGSKAAAA